MTINLSNAAREDPRAYVGPSAFRLPGKSARYARLRRNRQMLERGEMVRPRLIVRAVHTLSRYDNQRAIIYQYQDRWGFGRGDTFPHSDHGKTVEYYGANSG